MTKASLVDHNAQKCCFLLIVEFFSTLLHVSPVPDSPPLNILVHNTSVSSLNVSWEEVPSVNRRGILLGYRVLYAKDGIWDWKNVTTAAEVKQLELKGLWGYTRYCIKMAAFTRIGDGPVSEGCTYGRTHEGGM